MVNLEGKSDTVSEWNIIASSLEKLPLVHAWYMFLQFLLRDKEDEGKELLLK